MSKLFTQAALQGCSLAQLQALYNQEMRTLVTSESGSQDRRDALANLDTLGRAMARKRSIAPRL